MKSIKNILSWYMILFLFLFIQTKLIAQDSTETNSIPFHHETFFFPKIDIGVQKRLYYDIGISKDTYFGYCGNNASSWHIVFTHFPALNKNNKNVYGLKTGVFAWSSALLLGMEGAFYTDGNKNDFMLIPQVGIGVNLLSVSYGYAFSFKKYPFNEIRAHCVNLNFHWPIGLH